MKKRIFDWLQAILVLILMRFKQSADGVEIFQRVGIFSESSIIP